METEHDCGPDHKDHMTAQKRMKRQISPKERRRLEMKHAILTAVGIGICFYLYFPHPWL